VTGDLNKAIETLQVATQEYPLQSDNFINLGVFYGRNGDTEKASDTMRKALALQPDDSTTLEDSIGFAAIDNNRADADKYITAASRMGLNGTSLFLQEMMYYASVSDWNTVQKIVSETAGRPDQVTITSNLAALYPQLGQFQLARTTALRAADQAASVKAKDSQAAAILQAASVGWTVDRCFDPEKVAKQALQLDNSKVTQIAASTALAFCNAAKEAEQLLSNLEKRYPQDTLVQELNVPQSRAWLAIKAGDPQRALALLERVRAHDDASVAPYMRGLAYLQLKDSRNAIIAFQKGSRLKGLAYTIPSPYALCWLGLGRAYAMGGDKSSAKKAYDVFFTEWKNADSDLPVIAEAKKEYSQL
jgi:eukaryotic-like serine/threonine-protein kinase